MALLNNLGIRHKLWLAFGILITLLAAISLENLYEVSQLSAGVDEVVHKRQPAAFKSQELGIHLERSSSALGFYLMSKEGRYLTAYEEALGRAASTLRELRGLEGLADDPGTKRLLASMQQDFEGIREVGQRIVTASADPEQNFPGVAYANSNINPLSRTLQQLSAQMLNAEQTADGGGDRSALVVDLAQLRALLPNAMSAIRGYLAFRNEATLQNLNVYLEQIPAVLERIEGHGALLTFEQEADLEAYRETFAALRTRIAELLEIQGSDRWRTDSWLVGSELAPLFQELEHKARELMGGQRASIEATTQELRNDAATAQTLILVLCAAGVAVGALLAWLAGRSVTGPIVTVAETMAQIGQGQGDLSQRLNYARKDELGDLAQGYNAFADKLQGLVGQTTRSSTALIATIADTADGTASITRSILEQEREVEQVATAVNEMSSTISEVAQNAATAEEAANAAKDEAQSGAQVVEASTRSMESLSGQVESAAEVIQRLESDSDAIGGVLDVIRGITERTNLLALNAAIEAARAGEQGRGFAVVADEVRSLASRTHESAGEIEDVVQRLQAGARQAVEAMSSGRSQAETNLEQARAAQQALGTINQAIDTIRDMNAQIATASEEQSSVAEEINRNINSLSDSLKGTADKARENSDHADGLGQLAAELQQVVSRFNTAGAGELNFDTARAAHLAWRGRLRAFLDGRGSLTKKEAVSHHDCILGKWYFGAGQKRFGHLGVMQAIDPPHAEMHRLVRDIIQAREEGRRDDAEAMYARVSELSGQVVGLLNDLEREVAPDRQTAA